MRAVLAQSCVMVCLLGLSGFAQAEQGPGDVVNRVVNLIQELKSKIIADGKAEQKAYDRYACWCETTSARKATDIHLAMAEIKTLGAKILSNKGLVATRAAEIAALARDMDTNQGTQAQANSIRQKESASYNEHKTSMEQTMNALERAIDTLSGAGTKTAFLETDRPTDELTLLRTAAAVHEAAKLLPDDHQLSGKQLSMLSAFTADPSEFYDQKAQKKESYSPASATIQGILKDMYDTLAQNLERATQVEATRFKNFESVLAVTAKDLATLASTKTKKELEKADAEKVLSDAQQNHDDTKAELEASVALFDDTKKVCTSKSIEWSERVRARTEELQGIEKALEILGSDDAKALFNKAIKTGKETFFQVASSQGSSKPEVRRRVFNVLTKAATTSKSMRLAALAVSVREGQGHFPEVVAQVEKMIANLKKEQKDDFDHKDWCKEETFKNEQEASRYEYKVEKLNGKLAKFRAHLEELEVSRTSAMDQLREVRDDLERMEDTRKEARQAFESKKADDEAAVSLLAAALESLTAFYNNNDTGMGEVQGSIKLLQREPVFEISADQAPDATFTSAGKSTGEAKGIISTLTMIKEDLEDEIKNGEEDDRKSSAAFDAEYNAATTLRQDLLNKKTDLEEAISAVNGEIDDHDEEKADQEGNRDAEHEYLWSIKPDCTWISSTFDDRRKKRDTEIAGLHEAIGMLQGALAEAEQMGEPIALVQPPKQVFDDESFGRMHLFKFQG